MFDRDAALQALDALAAELHDRGVTARVFVVGGAAMALAFDARRMTRDIDAVFEPKSAVYDAARAVAERMQLPDDWLDDAVKGFVPGTDPDAVPIFERPNLSVAAASARFLLAMKLQAARVEQDADDIRFLANLLGLHSVDAVLDAARERYDIASLPPRAGFLVEELFGAPPAT